MIIDLSLCNVILKIAANRIKDRYGPLALFCTQKKNN